jgi:hypothetical protein
VPTLTGSTIPHVPDSPPTTELGTTYGYPQLGGSGGNFATIADPASTSSGLAGGTTVLRYLNPFRWFGKTITYMNETRWFNDFRLARVLAADKEETEERKTGERRERNEGGWCWTEEQVVRTRYRSQAYSEEQRYEIWTINQTQESYYAFLTGAGGVAVDATVDGTAALQAAGATALRGMAAEVGAATLAGAELSSAAAATAASAEVFGVVGWGFLVFQASTASWVYFNGGATNAAGDKTSEGWAVFRRVFAEREQVAQETVWVMLGERRPCRPRTGSEPAPSGAVTAPGGSATPVPAGGTSEGGSGGYREAVPRGGQSEPTPVSFGGKTGGSGGGFRIGMPVILGGGAAAFLAAAFGLFVVFGGGDDATETTTPGSTATAGTTASTAAATSGATTAATEAPAAYDHALTVSLYDVKWGDYLTLDAYAFGLLQETPFATTNDAYAGIPSSELHQSWGASPWSIAPGETFLSPGDQQRMSEGETLLVAAGVDFWEMSDGARQRVFFNTVFPCGEGVAAFTVCPDLMASSPGGEHVVAYAIFDEEIPLAHPERIYQYGFVFDADADAGNNYVPLDAYPKDFFADTDRWYALAYAPGTGWQLQVTNARDGQILGVPSAARAMIRGNTIMLVVPAVEFEVETPPYRATAFWHLGDYGFNPPFNWNADVQPPVGEPLIEPAHVVLEMAE